MNREKYEATLNLAEEWKHQAMHDDSLSGDERAQLWHDGVTLRGNVVLAEYYRREKRKEKVIFGVVFGFLALLVLIYLVGIIWLIVN